MSKNHDASDEFFQEIIAAIQTACMEGEYAAYYYCDEKHVAHEVKDRLVELGYTVHVTVEKSFFSTDYLVSVSW